ncbi:MAG: hypothetical protein OWU32_00995 [Firmicutes bacterium]|nr:hypothetical protein [Bacillota bacterium]
MDTPEPASTKGPGTLLLWSVAFFILFIRFMLVPISAYGAFLNLLVIVTLMIIPNDSAARFAVTRVLFLLAIFFTVEHFQYNEDETKNAPSLLGLP